MLTSCITSHACACGTTHTQRIYRCCCGWLALDYAGAVEHLCLKHHCSHQEAEGITQRAVIASQPAQQQGAQQQPTNGEHARQ
jgi:hypothetical protein